MKIIEKNMGPKVEYEVAGTRVTFQDELMLNLEKMERDFEVHIDICEDKFGMLTTGLGEKYVAQIDITERQYEFIENGVDEKGEPKLERVALPFSMENVTLTLWSMEG